MQVVIWTLSGLYMTAVDIDIIHGDHFIRQPAEQTVDAARLVDPAAAARALPRATGVRLHWWGNRPTYIVASDSGSVLVDAATGAALPPPSEADIRALARYWFTGDEPIASVQLIDQVPGEIRGRTPPLWRVEFEGWNKPTLYFAPTTGELLSRRHELWRIFDFLWMLHIMDYETRDNVNNTLLRVVTWGAAAMALSGAFLLLYSFPRRKRRKARR